MLGVYDFSEELEPFQGRSEEEITQIFEELGSEGNIWRI